jgi:hypothetical protein
MKLAGHIAYTILIGELEGLRSLGRLGCTSEINIGIDLESDAYEGVD